jgi:hypothetical protein
VPTVGNVEGGLTHKRMVCVTIGHSRAGRQGQGPCNLSSQGGTCARHAFERRPPARRRR